MKKESHVGVEWYVVKKNDATSVGAGLVSVRGITLVALVVTIIILLILAGISIASLGGENGLISRVTQAKKTQTKAEMKEILILSLQELQVEKEGKATLDDVTQEWANNTLKDYKPIITSDASISGKKVTLTKNDITEKYIIDEKLNIVETEEITGINLEYEVKSRNGEELQVVVTVTDNENGLQIIEYNDGHIQNANGLKSVSRDCIIQLGVEYKVKIISKSGEEKTETILINDYYHTIKNNLGEGITIDNKAVKTAYKKSYQATIIASDEYIIDTISVTMGGQPVEVDKSTGVINIEKVTGDIEITATAKKLEIKTTEPIIGTSTTSTSSVEDNSQTKGTKLYIKFSATLEGQNCTITPTIPYEITTNGTYKFTATGTYWGKTIEKEIEIQVNKYKSASGLVKYDAGEWTESEIQSLKNLSLYNININRSASTESGLNFTFGGFTYKNDTENINKIKLNTLITSRNQSVSPQSGYGSPTYDGWQILESEYDEITGKTYVKKIVHAGSPENFVYYRSAQQDTARVEYLFTGKLNYSEIYKTFSNGVEINVRNWDMYKDQKQLNLIDNVHLLTHSEAYTTSLGDKSDILRTGGYYWLGTTAGYAGTYDFPNVNNEGVLSANDHFCWGIRPVVEMVDDVYIASGSGTEVDPYVLGKD